jgi:hypothetical protein
MVNRQLPFDGRARHLRHQVEGRFDGNAGQTGGTQRP